jgi:hypothetical protein
MPQRYTDSRALSVYDVVDFRSCGFRVPRLGAFSDDGADVTVYLVRKLFVQGALCDDERAFPQH